MGRIRIQYRQGGNATFTVPAGVVSVQGQCQGPGAGGGTAGGTTGGGGGGAGGYGRDTFATTPGNTHRIHVGLGGTSPANDTVIRNAADSADLVRGARGTVGANGGITNQGAGGAGGTNNLGAEQTHSGGAGGGGGAAQTNGGGGGGCAGAGGAGGAGASNRTAGTAGAAGSPAADFPAGGAGRIGASTLQPAEPADLGAFPGGAGGGASTNQPRADGTRGQAVLIFEYASEIATAQELASLVVHYNRLFQDAAIADDDVALTAEFFRSPLDLAFAVDVFAAGIGKVLADSVGVVDLVTGKRIGLGHSDQATVLDARTLTAEFFRDVTDSVSVMEVAGKRIGLKFADSLGAQIKKVFVID